MKHALVATILLAGLLFADEPPPAENVNSRYKVESVQLARPIDRKIPRNLRDEVEGMVGRNFDPAAAADLTRRLGSELRLIVRYRIERGLQPEHVKVVYDARERRWDEDDAKVTKMTYHQKQGWTAGLEVGFDAGPMRFETGWQSDADRLLERYQGWNAGWKLQIREHVRFEFDFEHARQTWNPATELGFIGRPDVASLYRERTTMAPGVTVTLAPGLSVGGAIAVQHLDMGSFTQAANALVGTLRYRHGGRVSGQRDGPEIDAGYTVRSSIGTLDSDFVYTRHAIDGGYQFVTGPHHIIVRATAGVIGGTAPLFERFSLGDSRTLRGWNKFDLDPLGGSRMAHGSVAYRWRLIGVFYDTGAVWDRREDADTRHSVGVTLASGAFREGPYLTVAFPLRGGNFVPMFMMGMNF